MSSSPAYKRAIHLMEADVGDELVALDPEQGSCFGFNEVATWVWRRLEEPRSIDDLKVYLMAEYDVDEETCDKELRELLNDLETKGLIIKA